MLNTGVGKPPASCLANAAGRREQWRDSPASVTSHDVAPTCQRNIVASATFNEKEG